LLPGPISSTNFPKLLEFLQHNVNNDENNNCEESNKIDIVMATMKPKLVIIIGKK
jgi:hypothetical protein